MKLLHKISCPDKHFEIGAARWVVKENRDPSGGIFCKCGRNDCLSQDLDLLLIRRDQDADGWNSGPRRVDAFEFVSWSWDEGCGSPNVSQPSEQVDEPARCEQGYKSSERNRLQRHKNT